MTLAASGAPTGRDFLAISRRFLDALGADGLGSESDQRHFAVDGLEPSWVVLPATVAEAAQALRLCAEHDLAVVPAGLGVRLGLGAPPERVDVVLSTSRMSAVIEHAAADLTVTVEAGATLGAVNQALGAHGQWLPFDPPAASETTIGGLIAANVSGPSRQAYGTVRESLIGVHALLADGTAVKSGGRVVKNVAGYDLQKLLVGSLGTLALVVDATFKLRPLPQAPIRLAWSAPSVETLARAGAKLADSVLEPQSVELSAATDRPPRLIGGFAGGVERAVDAERRASDWLAELGAARVDSLLVADEPRSSPPAPASDAVVLRAGMRRDALGGWIDAALDRASSASAKASVAAHAGIGVARLGVDALSSEAAGDLVEALRDRARQSGGYLVVESVPAAWKKTLDVWGPPPTGFDLMRGIKAVYDPKRRLSPGRFVGGL